MMFRKKTAWLAPALLLIPMLAACGGPDPAVQPTPSNTTGAAATSPSAMMMTPTAMVAESPTAMVGMTPTGVSTGTAMLSTTDELYEVADCSYGGLMKAIEAVDDTTVKFTLCAPDPAFPSKIAFSSLGIQSAAHLQATNGSPLDNTVGTGPYRVRQWAKGDSLVLEANPNYWGEAPAIKNLVFKWNAEAAARLNSLRSGEADGIDNPDPNDFPSIQSDTNLQLYPRVALNVFYIGLNNTKPPLDNEKVRQALAMAIDRQAIVDKFYPPGSAVASYFTPCAIPGGCEGEAWYNFNLEQAKTMLTEAGFPNGFNIRLAYRDVVRGYLPTPGRVAEEIQAQLRQLNVTVTIDQQESTTFLDNASAGKLEMFLLGWGADYPDATNFLDSHFGTGANSSFGAKFDDITSKLQQAASLSDQAQRNALYADANNAIRTHVPMIPVAHGGSATVYGSQVTGGHSSPLSNETFRVMSLAGKDTFVWVQNGEPGSLYCADETDGEALRACEQIFDTLLGYKVGGTEVEPGLAETYMANSDLTEWTVKLRPNVRFSNDTALTARDVLKTFVVQWDAAHPLHKGRTGVFNYWNYLFTAPLNAPPEE